LGGLDLVAPKDGFGGFLKRVEMGPHIDEGEKFWGDTKWDN